MTQPINSPWCNEAIVARLAELWENHSATQICGMLWDEFRVHVTRNAVVGRLHRMKLTINDKKYVHPLTRNNSHGRPKVTASNRPSRAQPNMPAQPFVCRDALLLDPLHLSLSDLGPDDCRWPFGINIPYTFCGHPKASRWYCHAHQALSVGSGTSSERAASKGISNQMQAVA